MRRVVFDIESDGLIPQLTRVHSLVLVDADTGERLSCTNDHPDYPSIEHGLTVLATADEIIGHNIIGFDIPAIQKVYPDWNPTGRVFDTLVLVRTRWAHIKDSDFARAKRGKLPSHMIGRHSIAAWGHRLGVNKAGYTEWCKEQGITDPWSTWRQEMQDYCEQDVVVNIAVLRTIEQNPLPEEVVETETELTQYLLQQEANGWPFDMEKAIDLQALLVRRRETLVKDLVAHFGIWYTPEGRFVPKRNNKTQGYVAGCEATRIKLQEFNPGSRDHIADRLQKLYGWEPEIFTPSGKPQVDEKTLKALDFPVTNQLVEFLTIEKRLGQLAEGRQAWLKQVTDEGKIHHRVNPVGAVTHRATHSNPNLAQVPSSGAAYGEQCRELFTVPEGWLLVGSDASGLELRCLAHYMARYDDGAYVKAVTEGRNEDGTDIHSVNAEALGLPRPAAKTFIYAYLYGAGDEKLGSIVDPEGSPEAKKKAGKKLRRRFEKKIPALGHLSAAVKAKAKVGYLNLIDGRRAYVRSPHAALNTLLQGTGAIICKRWIVHFNRRLRETFGPQGWDGKWAALGWIHDEVQIAVRPEIADEFCRILIEEIEGLTAHYSFRCPLTGDAQTGQSWKDTH